MVVRTPLALPVHFVSDVHWPLRHDYPNGQPFLDFLDSLDGMGGTLMTRILDVSPPLKGARLCVLQPMRAQEDIRRWLYERCYPILDDRVIFEAGRYYQVFSIGSPERTRQTLPQGWPEGCFFLGYTAFLHREPLLKPLAERLLEGVRRKQKTQRAAALESQAEQLETILRNWQKLN